LASVSRLVSKATPATPSVKAFSAAVTAKVLSKNPLRFGLHRCLVDKAAAVEAEFVGQRGNERRNL